MAFSSSRLTLYAIISAIEEDLRKAIVQFLPETTPEQLFGKDLLSRASERYQKDKDGDTGTPSSLDILPYIDFADSYQLLNNKASELPKHVAVFLSRSTHRLEKLAAIRNRVAHSRPLLFDDFSRTLETSEEFIGSGAIPWNALQSTLQRLKTEPSFVLNLQIPELHVGRQNHNLPLPDFDETGFVGRKHEVEDVKNLLLGAYPVVTLVGEGGLGKTALALKVAYDLLDLPTSPFESIVWTTSKTKQLTAQEIIKIESAISDSLGLLVNVANELAGDAAGGDPLQEVLSYLSQFKILLVLDNLETVLDDRVRNFLQKLPTGSKILITSRIGLGAFEFPYKLQPFTEGEAVQLLRSLSTSRSLPHLRKVTNAKLAKYCEKMHRSPGFIKWFVSAVQAGRRPEDVLANPDVFLDFCLTNVYDYLTDTSKKVLRCMLCVPVLNSLAELTYLTHLDFLELQKALQQLLTTNMIVMTSIPTGSSFETRYAISDLPREYMLKHHPVKPEEYADLIQRRNQMESQGDKIRAEASGDPWALTSIDMRSKRDLIVARYLLDALADSVRGNFTRAETALDMARQLAPEYYEVYRVEAAVKTMEKNYPAAIGAYEAALELEPTSAKVRHAFGSFHLICLSDPERAIEQFQEGIKIRPHSFHLQSDYVRALFYLKRFEEARVVLDELLSRAPTNRHVSQRIKLVDLNLQYYSRKADFSAISGGDVKIILSDLESLIREFKQIPPEWVDDKMKRRLIKSIPNARKCLREIGAEAERTRAETALMELYEIQPVVASLFPKNTHRGSVARIFQSKGFGFVSTAEGKELFFGIDGMQMKKEWTQIAEGTPVDFQIGQNKKGACAVNVRIRKMIPGTSLTTSVN